MLYRVSLTALAGLTMATGAAYLCRWRLAIFSILPVMALLIGAGLALIGLALRRNAKSQVSAPRHSFSTNLLLSSLFLVLQLAYFPAGQGFRNREIDRAQAFLESLIPKLENYNLQNDGYPQILTLLPSLDAPFPPLLQLHGPSPFAYDNRNFYQTQDTSYRFQFYVPDGFIGYQYIYCCGADGTWIVTD